MPERPGVCVVTHPLSAAGENATRTLLEVLAAVTSVALITADLPGGSAIRGRHEVVEITRAGAGSSVPVAGARFLLNQLRMCREIARRDEEVVLFFGATAYLLPVAWARLIGRTVVVEPRGDVPLTLRLAWERRLPAPVARFLAGAVRALERLSFRLADAIVTYTPGVADQLDLEPFAHKLHTDGARYVDVERFSPSGPFEERPRTAGFVGRLDEEKGIRDLAAVARRLPDGVTFRFVGDGDLRGWLETALAGEIDAGEVEVTGWVDHDDVPRELGRLRLVVLFSKPTEGLPTTVLEALACGTPVLATPVSGVPDVISEGETGFLLDATDPAAVADRIAAILDRDDLDRIARNGRRLVEREYSFEAAVERYGSILDSIYSM